LTADVARGDASPVAELAPPAGHEQTRARYPDADGYVDRDGVKLHYEVYGSGEPTVFLLPTGGPIARRPDTSRPSSPPTPWR
jgi:hypothetical protein